MSGEVSIVKYMMVREKEVETKLLTVFRAFLVTCGVCEMGAWVWSTCA